jgi:hypothetical protein
MFTNPSSIKEHRVLLSHSFLNLNRNGSPGIHSSNLNLFWKDPRALGSNLLSLTLPGGCNRTTSSDGMNLSLIFFSVSPREGNSWFKSNWGRFLYSNSITIRYRLFYRSRHVCPGDAHRGTFVRGVPSDLDFLIGWIRGLALQSSSKARGSIHQLLHFPRAQLTNPEHFDHRSADPSISFAPGSPICQPRSTYSYTAYEQ